MWKYKCRTEFFALLAAFGVGFLLSLFAASNDSFFSVLESSLPGAAQVVEVLKSNPMLIGLSGGLGMAGLANVLILGNIISSYYSGFSFLYLVLLFMFPTYLLSAGTLLFPVSLVVFLYGWLSLDSSKRKALRQAKITGDDEIVRMYLLHHPLQEEYKDMAMEARKTMDRVSLIYALGLTAVFCALFFIDNLLISLLAVLLCMFAFRALSRLRAQTFQQISNLLYEKCDPEACLSALIFMSQRKNHYKLVNRALFAQCLIYLDDPSLAQDVLIYYSRPTAQANLAYWSLMAYSYYLLKDENGVLRCRDELSKIRPPMGAMGLMVKSEELNSVENKVQLMQGDFNSCKKYYLDLLKRAVSKLQRADCDYYIALISFVQEDYVVARQYFENTIRNGGELYFVRNARNYLKKIEETNAAEQISYGE